jgi:hypothetical protein
MHIAKPINWLLNNLRDLMQKSKELLTFKAFKIMAILIILYIVISNASKLKFIYNIPADIESIKACVAYDITGGVSADVTEKQVLEYEELISKYKEDGYTKENGQDIIVRLIYDCQTGQDIARAFDNNPNKINSFLQQENPRSFVLNQFPDLGLETNQYKNLILRSRWQQNHLTNLLNPSLIAKVLVISSFPSYQYNEQIKTIVPQFVIFTIFDGKFAFVSTLDFTDRYLLCESVVDDQIEKALKYAPHTDWSTFKSQYINPINNVILDPFLIGLNERWHTIWQGIQEYEYMKEHGTSPHNNTKITPEKLDEFSKKLKYLIYDIEGDYPPSFLDKVDKKMKIYDLEAKKKLPPSTSPKAMSQLLQDYDLIVKWHNRYAWHSYYLERGKLKNYIELLKLRYTINTSIIKALFKDFINS